MGYLSSVSSVAPARWSSFVWLSDQDYLVKSDALSITQSIIDYRFKDPARLELSLRHASATPTRLQSNERLEFLGDVILGLVVCERLFKNHPDLEEGEMTKIKSAVVSRNTCAKISKSLGLCDQLILGKGMPSPSKLPGSVSAAVFEAVIGAIYLDGGLQSARKFILKNVQFYIDEALANEHQYNFKSMLQQAIQRRLNSTPEYKVLDEKGPDHSKCFEICAVIQDKHYPSAWGGSKKTAEQEAARRALIELNLLDEGSDQSTEA